MSRQSPFIDRSSASAPASANASACPGLLRIVPARDGGICRVRLPGGRLPVEQAFALADAAAQHGSGVLEITNRANVQVRGIEPLHEALLVERLLAAGLGPTVAGADDVRNLMLSPAAGIDAGASFDVRPLAEQILDVLQTRTALHRLSPKFALQLDGGEDAAMLEHPHDLWLAALPDGEHLAFGLAGCPPLPGSPAPAAGVLSARDVPEFIDIALHLFLACATPGQARMRQLLATMPASEFLSKLQARLSFRLEPASLQWRRSSPRVAAHIGIHAQREPALCYVGAAPALGRIDSAQLRALAALARECGGELRTTPWQSVLLANIPAQLAPRIARALQGIGFECDAGAVLAHTIACSGASGCARGLADTKSDARVLARSLQQHIADRAAGRARPDVPSVHLTGCARSCAAAHCAAFTLLAVAPGRYALFQRVEGGADFGRQLAASVDVEAAGALIAGTSIFNHDSNHDPETDT